MKLFIYTLLLVLPVSLNAQQNLAEEVKSLFEDTSHLEWIHSYAGSIDNMTKVEASLGFDGTYCRGIMYYPSSGFSTEIAGTAIGNKLQVNEVNEDGYITGKLSGVITNDYINASWSNHNNTIGCNYKLINDSAPAKTIKKDGQDKWVRWYNGKVAEEQLHVILHKRTDKDLYGSCYNENGTRSYTIKGTLEEDKSVHLKFYLGEQEMATFKGKISRRKQIQGLVTGIGLIDENMTLYLDNKINYQQTAFQSFNTSYEILLPEYGSNDFDKFIKTITSDWLKECVDKGNNKSYRESDIPAPEDRLVNRAYIYPDIRYVSDNVISGHMVFVNTWTGQTKTKTINYDLKEDKEISLDQLFANDIVYQDSLRTYLKLSGRKEFKLLYFNITPEGLRIYDEFDPVNGRNDIIIPYTILKPWARKGGPLKKLL